MKMLGSLTLALAMTCALAASAAAQQEEPAHATRAMRQVALALHNYIEANRELPPQALVDDGGKRLLSWRVLILPYMGENELYEAFRLDEPWDSPHNLELASQIPEAFQDAQAEARTPPKTRIVAPLTSGSAFGRPGRPVRLTDIVDGTSQTVWLVETTAEKAVVWTKPEDLVVDSQQVFQSLAAADAKNLRVGLADGSTRLVSAETKNNVWNALLSIAGQEVIDFKEVK